MNENYITTTRPVQNRNSLGDTKYLVDNSSLEIYCSRGTRPIQGESLMRAKGMWKKFASRQDLVGRDVEDHDDNGITRGRVMGVSIKKGCLVVRIRSATRRLHNGTDRSWYPFQSALVEVPISICSAPFEVVGGTIKIRIHDRYSNSILFLPSGDNLNPEQVQAHTTPNPHG